MNKTNLIFLSFDLKFVKKYLGYQCCKNTINKRKIENPKKYFKFIKVKQTAQSS